MHTLTKTHARHLTLLNRLGRCLAFGCTSHQTLRAASLASRLTRAWPSAFLAAEGYVPPGEVWRVGSGRGDGPDGVREVAEAANRGLLGRVLGEGRFTAVGDDVRVYPVPGLKLKPNTTLTSLSRFGEDASQTLPTLSQIPPAWSPGNKSLLMMQSAVFSAAMRPVATVREVLRVESTGDGSPEAGGSGNTEALGRFLRVFEDGVRAGREEVEGLEGAVREFERETWDREGAVEDMGSAKG